MEDMNEVEAQRTPEVAESKDSPAGGSEPVPLRIVRLAKNSVMAHLAAGRFSIAEVELLASLGAECTARGGDADPLDQLTFRLRQRLEQQLAMVAVVRRGRAATKGAAC